MQKRYILVSFDWIILISNNYLNILKNILILLSIVNPLTLNAKILRQRQINKHEAQTTTQFYMSQRKKMTRQDLDGLITSIRTKGEKRYDNFDLKLIRVLNGANWVSFTDYDDLEDYYNGKVSDASKFYEFSQVQLTCIYS